MQVTGLIVSLIIFSKLWQHWAKKWGNKEVCDDSLSSCIWSLKIIVALLLATLENSLESDFLASIWCDLVAIFQLSQVAWFWSNSAWFIRWVVLFHLVLKPGLHSAQLLCTWTLCHCTWTYFLLGLRAQVKRSLVKQSQSQVLCFDPPASVH